MLQVASICGVSLPSAVHIKSKRNLPILFALRTLHHPFLYRLQFPLFVLIHLMLVVLPFVMHVCIGAQW